MPLPPSPTGSSDVQGEEADLSVQTTNSVARKTRIIEALKEIDDSAEAESQSVRISSVLAQPEQESPPLTEATETHILSTRLLIILALLFSGASTGIVFMVKSNRALEKAACELLQKGRPVQKSRVTGTLLDSDSLTKLIGTCADREVVLTYGCAAKSVIDTAKSPLMSDDVSQELLIEALRIAQETKCD